jgi:PAS domain-containing protein
MGNDRRFGGRRRFRRRRPPGDLGTTAMVERVKTPACVVDGSGRIVAANRPLEALLGTGAAGGLQGRTLTSLAYPPDVELPREALTALFGDGVDRYQVDSRSVRIHTRELVQNAARVSTSHAPTLQLWQALRMRVGHTRAAFWGTWDLSLVRDGRGRPALAIAMCGT